jgi:hypothetical protein
MTWLTTEKPLPSGWYWYRSDKTDTAPEVIYSNGTSNVRVVVSFMDYQTDESDDWSGEWSAIQQPKEPV